MSKTYPRRIVTCGSCGVTAPNKGRGLCSRCYFHATADSRREKRRLKALDAPDRPEWSRDLLLYEVEFFTEWCGLKPSEIAGRLGWERSRFEKAMARARAAGEPRALAFYEKRDRENMNTRQQEEEAA